MIVFIAFLILRTVDSCTPTFSTPLIPPPAAQPINLLSNPQLPPIAFQVDEPIPQSRDYSDEPVDIQRDSIIPLHTEKLKQRFSLFDMFRPLALPATTPPILITEKLTDTVSLNITFSPPVHWTFCIPSCGVNDQAVDVDDAYEKAKDDVLEAVQSSCSNAGVKCKMESVELQYYPESVLIEDFGPYFDLSGNRYKISGKTVPYKINNLNPGIIKNFVLPMKINFKLTSPVPEATTKNLKQKVIDYLAARKFLHISSESS
ncbi:hypothetical protein GCK72_023881 [Caenorhabditis remanei]|uniref:SEA domain-containing protein n=1 Tax=Caenorhabditis remanei TaxID=31234 RepID=A0A6A5FYH2_CAERE|nr:hypothetical protein GCK72_023881 [Caenorhabditis remanei]KAF1747419.1 hypothetical protein GCK72_023881 [Caenorhabditis remanei]